MDMKGIVGVIGGAVVLYVVGYFILSGLSGFNAVGARGHSDAVPSTRLNFQADSKCGELPNYRVA